jgi:germination protein M
LEIYIIASMRRRRPRIGRTGCLFWLFIVLVIIVILIYRSKGSFKETISSFFTPRQAEKETIENVEIAGESGRGESPDLSPDKGEPLSEGAAGKPEEKGGTAGGGDRDVPSDTATSADTGTSQDQIAQKEKEKSEIRPKSLTTALYFISIDQSTGNARLFPVVKSIEFIDSPITRTMDALLRGPSDSDRKRGAATFIPPGTKLISARIEGGHLTLNFSGEFESNTKGRQAVLFQLDQIMYTAFEFDQVSSVSILVDGVNKPYITGDGIPLKQRYTQDDLPTTTSG